jgi:hypothetical protein
VRSRRTHALFDAHFDAVRAYCIRRLPLAEANDATSEVFLIAWRRLEDIPQDGERRGRTLPVGRRRELRRAFSTDLTEIRLRLQSDSCDERALELDFATLRRP